MFRTLAIVGLIVALTLALASRARRGPIRGYIVPAGRFPAFARVVFIVSAALAFGLATTGFYAPFVLDAALSGWPLLLHVALGGALVVALPMLALLRGEMHATSPAIAPARKTCFWAFLTLGLVAGATILLSMSPLFGAQGMEFLLSLHKAAGALLAMALIGLLVGR